MLRFADSLMRQRRKAWRTGPMDTNLIAETILHVFRKGNAAEAAFRQGGWDADYAMYTDLFFHEILARERRRVDRSGKALFILLLDIHRLFDILPEKNLINKLTRWTEQCIRESDIKGWLRNRHTVGVIYTEVMKSGKEPILRKCKEALAFEFGQELIKSIGVTFSVFPEEYGSGTGRSAEAGSLKSDYHVIDSATGKHSMTAKRLIDIAGSLILLLLLTPLLIVIAAGIRLTSPGPALFIQERVGEGGRHFRFFKFRTMYRNADSTIHRKYVLDLIKSGSTVVDDGTVHIYKLAHDSRVTKIGQLLRKTSLDELPQLFNVLKGDMSLVGPRPALPYEVENYRPWYLRRVFGIKPGITGIWQVEGRSRTPFETMVRMDLRYIQKWSLLLDFQLLLKTVFAMYRGGY